MAPFMDVWNSSLAPHDKLHKGPNQAGNKSLISWNSAIGIPGYSGFCPATAAVVLPIRVGVHTGRPVDDKSRLAATLSTVDGKVPKASEHAASYRRAPGDASFAGRTGGGYWITKRAEVESPAFNHTTTYQAEVQNGQETAGEQLQRSIGLACTLPMYEAARQMAPRAQTADSALRTSTTLESSRALSASLPATHRPATAVTSSGEVVGYVTTNNARFVRNPLTGGDAAPGAPHRHRDQPRDIEPRYQTMPRAMPPGMYGSGSTYLRDFGEDCSDPMDRSVPSERFQTRCGTTKDLSAGTTRATNNPPGYTGHIAASKYNGLAQAQSAAADERLDSHSDMLLYKLDQWSRLRIPHCTAYKPQAARNITTIQPAQGPTKKTTSGAANAQATKHGVPHIDNTHHNNSRAGILTFFSSTGETVSETGLAHAQMYYASRDPGENMKHSHLPHHTAYGKAFNPRNSMV